MKKSDKVYFTVVKHKNNNYDIPVSIGDTINVYSIDVGGVRFLREDIVMGIHCYINKHNGIQTMRVYCKNCKRYASMKLN